VRLHLRKRGSVWPTHPSVLATEAKRKLTRHFAKKLDDELDELWDNGQLDHSHLDEIYNMDLHKDL
jgi:hypothetical protein